MSEAAVLNVAKKNAKKTPDTERKPMALQIRGSEEWKAAIDRLSVLEGLPLASLVDRALRRYAKEVGFTEDIPKR